MGFPGGDGNALLQWGLTADALFPLLYSLWASDSAYGFLLEFFFLFLELRFLLRRHRMIPISESERLPLCFNCFSFTLALVGSTTRVIYNDFIGL